MSRHRPSRILGIFTASILHGPCKGLTLQPLFIIRYGSKTVVHFRGYAVRSKDVLQTSGVNWVDGVARAKPAWVRSSTLFECPLVQLRAAERTYGVVSKMTFTLAQAA